jgi:hypothetical protein
MINERHCYYRGSGITTRWTEAVDWRARQHVSKGAHTAAHRFVGSFSVASDGSNSCPPQRFLRTGFASSEAAAENALAAAKSLIDAQLADELQSQEQWLAALRIFR